MLETPVDLPSRIVTVSSLRVGTVSSLRDSIKSTVGSKEALDLF